MYKYIDTCIYVMFTITLQQSAIAYSIDILQACNRSPRHINTHESSSSSQGLRLALERVDSTAGLNWPESMA
jgi:hypothetical protein